MDIASAGHTIVSAVCAALASTAMISKDWFDVLHKIITFGFSVVVFAYGRRKVEDFYKTYQSKKLDATFNFYTNLDALIRRLYFCISDYSMHKKLNEYLSSDQLKESPPSDVLRCVWGDTSVSIGESDRFLLKSVVTDFLRFISTSREQIPPSVTKKELDEWNKNKSILITFLYALMPDMPRTYKRTIQEKHGELCDILDYFMKKIERAYEEYSEKAITGIMLSEKTLKMTRGMTNTLSFSYALNLEDDTTKTATWESSNPSAVTVDENGVISAVGTGRAIITVRANGKIAFCEVTVT